MATKMMILLAASFTIPAAFPQDLSKECKFALLVGFGKDEKEEATSAKSIDQIKAALIDHWGFPKPLVQAPVNGNAVRKDILRDLDDIELKLKDRDPKKVGACYIKIHLQGHGHRGDPADDKKADPPVNPPDKNKDRVGYDTAGGGHIWDFELEDRLKKLSDLLKQKGFKKQALIVQADFCYAEGIFGQLAQNVPSNMNLAWSADKSHTCTAWIGLGQPTPFTNGFTGAFSGEKPPTVEDAHKQATDQKGLKGSGAGFKDGDPKTPVNPSGK